MFPFLCSSAAPRRCRLATYGQNAKGGLCRGEHVSQISARPECGMKPGRFMASVSAAPAGDFSTSLCRSVTPDIVSPRLRRSIRRRMLPSTGDKVDDLDHWKSVGLHAKGLQPVGASAIRF